MHSAGNEDNLMSWNLGEIFGEILACSMIN